MGEEQRIGKTLGTDLATGKLTLPLMMLLERVSASERASIVAALQGGQALGLAASRQRMKEMDIAAAVRAAIEDELTLAVAALNPHADLAPVPLMFQLADILRHQVAVLETASIAG